MPLSGDPLDDDAVLTPFHEAFHALVQPSWSVPSAQNRATRYPIKTQPRVLRAMTLQRMIAAYYAATAPAREQALGQAAFFYERWKRRYADEYRGIKAYDAREGTAVYAEVTGMALWKTGSMQPATIKPLVAKWLAHWLPTRSSDVATNDRESYGLGVTASLLLDEIGPGDWKQQVTQGASPLDLLLGPVAAIPSRVDPTIRRTLTRLLGPFNEAIGEMLHPALRRLNQRRTVRVALDAQPTGSFNPGYFVTTRGHNWFTLMDGTFEAGGRRITLSNVPVINDAPKRCGFGSPAGHLQLTLLVPAAHVHLRTGRLTVRGVKNLRLRGVKVRSGGRVEGQRVLCVR